LEKIFTADFIAKNLKKISTADFIAKHLKKNSTSDFIEKILKKISTADFIAKNLKKISTADFIEKKSVTFCRRRKSGRQNFFFTFVVLIPEHVSRRSQFQAFGPPFLSSAFGHARSEKLSVIFFVSSL
jgi:hypothetical protein